MGARPTRRTSERKIASAVAPRAAVPLTWVNSPQQDRSRRTLERLLDATEEIIRTRGIDAVTVPEVARAARSSIGSFYARFPDKGSLLRTLHERACAQSLATAETALDPARWEQVETEDLVRAFIAFVVHLFAARRPMMLAFGTALAGDPVFVEQRARTAAALGDRVRGLFLRRRASIGHPTPARAIDLCLRIVTSTLEQRNSLETAGAPEIAISDAVLIEELSRVVLRYLDVR